MAINIRLKQFLKIGLTVASMVAEGSDIPKDEPPLRAEERQVRQALPQNYSDLLSGEHAEELQPYLDLMRETGTGQKLLDSMRQNKVSLIYLEPLMTENAAMYFGAYSPESNIIRLAAKGSPPEILWSLFHEAEHSRTHNKLKSMGYAQIPTSTLDDAYIANAIDEALAERTAAQGFFEVLEKHPEIKDQKSDYYEKIAKKFMESHPELARYEINKDIGNSGLKKAKEWLKEGYKPADIVQGLYEERLLGYEDSLADYEGQTSVLYDPEKNKGYKMGVNPDWGQYVTKLTNGEVTDVPYFPECTVWGLHDRLSNEFVRLGNDITKIDQVDLSCPINQSYKDAFIREGMKIYAGYAFASLYDEVPSVRQDILKLTGCNPCEVYKNSAGVDIAYYDTSMFKQAAQTLSPEEYMAQACKIYANPDVQKFLDATAPATKAEVLAIMTMKDVLFTPNEKIPSHIRPIKQVYDGAPENPQKAENKDLFQQEALNRLRDPRS